MSYTSYDDSMDYWLIRFFIKNYKNLALSYFELILTVILIIDNLLLAKLLLKYKFIKRIIKCVQKAK